MKNVTYTYQLTRYKDFTTYLAIDGNLLSIEFTGGFIVPFKYNGTFSTTDNKIAKALEESPNYNSEYIKITSLEVTQENSVTVTPINPIDPGKELEPVLGITSGQKARAYLLSRFDELKSSDLRTNDIIIEVALTKGITFPDWELN